MIALIDGDLICYRVAAAYNNESLDLAINQAEALCLRLLQEVGTDEYNFYLTGSNNFRHQYNPTYKANRKDMEKPQHLEALREYFVLNHGAKVSDGCEADDEMGIYQSCNPDSSVIVSLDKDLLMIVGRHYSWEISGKTQTGSWTRPAFFTQVTPLDGLRHFYTQMIMGDKADNVFGFDGKMRAKIPQKLQSAVDYLHTLDDEEQMAQHVFDMYCDFDSIPAAERFYRAGISLWIQRCENERWVSPLGNKETEGALNT